jgi:subtilisin-like proprotein convertase family protein
LKLTASILFLIICNLIKAQVFNNNIPLSIIETTIHEPTIIPIQVSGLPSNINDTFGLESVCFNINHPELNNLTIKLVSPDGTKVTMIHQLGWTEDNFINTCIDDSSPSIYGGSPPFTGFFRSTLPLGQVNNGQNPNGIWHLWIYDDIPSSGSSGTFINVQLYFSQQPAVPFTFINSDLPIIQIDTKNKSINNYNKVLVDFKTFDHSSGINNWKNDSPTFDAQAYIEWQGWSGPGLPKKNFDIDLADLSDLKVDTSLLGMPSENDWVLKAEYLDRTFMKNHLVYDLFRKMGRYAPRVRYCELILDGEYIGLYTLQEKIKRGKNRVEIDKLTANEFTSPSISGGYIYEINWTGNPFDWTSSFPPINDATSNYNVEFRVIYPDRDNILSEQLNYLKTYTDDFESALNSSNFQDSLVGYRNYIDVYSFIDFMLISEFSGNYDTYGRSFYLTKENDNDGGKLKAGPPWDFDQAFGYYIPSTDGWVWEITNYYWPFPFWWSKFWSDEQYRIEAECRWKSYRNDLISDFSISHLMDSLNQRIQNAVFRNNFVWRDPAGISYETYRNNMETWIGQRLSWIDDSLNQYNLTFPALPNVFDTTICAGDTIDFLLPNTCYYDWDPGTNSSLLIPEESGVYTLTATNNLGCFTKQSVFIEILKPDADFNVNPIEGNHDVVFIAADTSLQNYVWSINQSNYESNYCFPYSFSINGYYNIALTALDTNGCSWSNNETYWVNTLFPGNQDFYIFPNPAENAFKIIVKEALLGSVYKIYDSAGKLIDQNTISSQELDIQSLWDCGIYFIEINSTKVSIIKL